MLSALSLFAVSAWAMDDEDQAGDDEPLCSKVLVFPVPQKLTLHQEILPYELRGKTMPSSLRHILDLATSSSRQKEIRGETVFFISRDDLKAAELDTPEVVSNDSLAVADNQAEPIQIPMLRTYPLKKVRLEGYTQVVAVLENGHPVQLEHLPRSANFFALLGLKTLSDARVTPPLLGVTKIDDGSLMAVYPLCAGYERTDLTVFRIGLDIRYGHRDSKALEPFEQTVARIKPLEDLLDRLIESRWPLLNYSLNPVELLKSRPDVGFRQIIDALKFPLWEFHGPEAKAPFFYPNYFATGKSTWLPADLKTEVLFLSKEKSTPIDNIVLRVPLERLDPHSQFGRLTLLRFEFFMSLINGKAKVNYLNFLLKKSPSDQKSLLQLIDALAIPSEQPKLLEFTSNYRARRYREAFRVLDGKI